MGKRKRRRARTTIFDDVFRTMLERTPQLFIPLINEVFGTDYPFDAKVVQYKNEHFYKWEKRVTDATLGIGLGDKRYHIECQSNADGSIVIRMFEYAVLVALENVKTENGVRRIEFPQSCIIYLRGKKNKKEESLQVVFPDGQTATYRVPVVYAQTYTEEEIFKKHLLIFLPYYMIKNEKRIAEIAQDEEKTKELLTSYSQMLDALSEVLSDSTLLREDLCRKYFLDCIGKVSGYITRKEEKLSERIGDVMGGKVLYLRTDALLDQGRAEGRAEGRKEGANRRNKEIALKMLKRDMPEEDIMDMTGITEQDLQALKEMTFATA